MRTLTLVVESNQPDANWIWESHRNNELINGVKIQVIASGNELERLEKELDSALDDLAKADYSY